MTMRTERAVLLVVMVLLLAGCSTQTDVGGSPTAEPDGGTPTAAGDAAGDGTVYVYLSDEPNAIDRFEHLNVTVTAVSFRAGGDVEGDARAGANADASAEAGTGSAAVAADATVDASADAGAEAEAGDGWLTHPVESRSVDLTRLRGDYATALGGLTVPAGGYTAVRLHVSAVEGTLTSGESAAVKLPSGGLTLHQSFAVGAGTETDFVFDATVFEAGKSGKYVLKPVASESGVDRPIRLVDAGADADAGVDVEAGGNDSADAGVDVGANATVPADGTGSGVDVTAGANVSEDVAVEVVEAGLSGVTVAITEAGDPVAGAAVAIDGEVAGETDADGRVTVPLPEDPVVEVTVETDEGVMRTTLDIDAYLGVNDTGTADANA